MRYIFFPDDMREFVVTRNHVFAASLRSAAKIIIILFFVLLGIFFVPLVSEYGFGLVLEHADSLLLQFAGTLWPVLIALVLLGLFMYFQSGRQKVIGIPIRYGFDETSVYFHDRYGSSMFGWDYFYSWRETEHFFLLHDGVRKILWPKSVWSAEELEAQRALMRTNISRKRDA